MAFYPKRRLMSASQQPEVTLPWDLETPDIWQGTQQPPQSRKQSVHQQASRQPAGWSGSAPQPGTLGVLSSQRSGAEHWMPQPNQAARQQVTKQAQPGLTQQCRKQSTVATRPQQSSTQSTVAVSALSLETYSELQEALTKGTGSAQPVPPVERAFYKLNDLKQLLLIHGIASGSKGKQDLLDRMAGLQLLSAKHVPAGGAQHDAPPALPSTAQHGAAPPAVQWDFSQDDLVALGWATPSEQLTQALACRGQQFTPAVTSGSRRSQAHPQQQLGLDVDCAAAVGASGATMQNATAMTAADAPATNSNMAHAGSDTQNAPTDQRTMRSGQIASGESTGQPTLRSGEFVVSLEALLTTAASQEQPSATVDNVRKQPSPCMAGAAAALSSQDAAVGSQAAAHQGGQGEASAPVLQPGVWHSKKRRPQDQTLLQILSMEPDVPPVSGQSKKAKHTAIPAGPPAAHGPHEQAVAAPGLPQQAQHAQQAQQLDGYDSDATVASDTMEAGAEASLGPSPQATAAGAGTADSNTCCGGVHPDGPAWLAGQIAALSGTCEAAELDADLPGGSLVGRRVASVLLEDFEQDDPRGVVDVIRAGLHDGRVVEHIGHDHDPDVCSEGCTCPHNFYYVRMRVDESAKAGPAGRARLPATARRLDLKLDLHASRLCTSLQQLLTLDPTQLQDAWVLLQPRQVPAEQPPCPSLPSQCPQKKRGARFKTTGTGHSVWPGLPARLQKPEHSLQGGVAAVTATAIAESQMPNELLLGGEAAATATGCLPPHRAAAAAQCTNTPAAAHAMATGGLPSSDMPPHAHHSNASPAAHAQPSATNRVSASGLAGTASSGHPFAIHQGAASRQNSDSTPAAPSAQQTSTAAIGHAASPSTTCGSARSAGSARAEFAGAGFRQGDVVWANIGTACWPAQILAEPDNPTGVAEAADSDPLCETPQQHIHTGTGQAPGHPLGGNHSGSAAPKAAAGTAAGVMKVLLFGSAVCMEVLPGALDRFGHKFEERASKLHSNIGRKAVVLAQQTQAAGLKSKA